MYSAKSQGLMIHGYGHIVHTVHEREFTHEQVLALGSPLFRLFVGDLRVSLEQSAPDHHHHHQNHVIHLPSRLVPLYEKCLAVARSDGDHILAIYPEISAANPSCISCTGVCIQQSYPTHSSAPQHVQRICYSTGA